MQSLFKAIPASLAWHIGRFASDASRKYTQNKTDIPQHIHDRFFAQCRADGIDVVIHGRTHKAEMKRMEFNGKPLLYINSGHWFGPCHYVVYRHGEFELKEFVF